jgi:uncharacterized membrane protein YhaH (DUF805 family)
MWSALFSYDGEINRVRFAASLGALAILAAVLFVGLSALGAAALVALGRTSPLDRALAAMVLTPAVVVPLTWSGCVLQAQRLRNMGVRPLVGIAVLALGALMIPVLASQGGLHIEAAWMCGVTAMLLLWPGREVPRFMSAERQSALSV